MMARNSPKQYAAHLAAQGRPAPKPRPAVRLRNEASKIRMHAQRHYEAMLAKAAALDELADELDGIGAKEGQ